MKISDLVSKRGRTVDLSGPTVAEVMLESHRMCDSIKHKVPNFTGNEPIICRSTGGAPVLSGIGILNASQTILFHALNISEPFDFVDCGYGSVRFIKPVPVNDFMVFNYEVTEAVEASFRVGPDNEKVSVPSIFMIIDCTIGNIAIGKAVEIKGMLVHFVALRNLAK